MRCRLSPTADVKVAHVRGGYGRLGFKFAVLPSKSLGGHTGGINEKF